MERLVALADSAGPLPDDLTVVALRCREDAPDLRCREDAPDLRCREDAPDAA